MEVVVPVMAPSAPCSPRTAAIAGGDHLPAYCYFFSSAPTSPSRASCAAASPGGDEASTFDFTLGFSGQLQGAAPTLAAADELFEGGRIRPLNTPHPSILRVDAAAYSSSCSASAGATRRSPRRAGSADRQAEAPPLERGRSGCRPAAAAAASSKSRRATRSLSPFRGGGGLADDDDESPPQSPRASSMMRGCGSGSGSRKWRLKDLFLFRSASEGRATGGGSKDPLFKYTMLSSSSSSSSTSSQPLRSGGGDGSASMRKGRGSAASASDMPYAVTRAAAEDARRRTTATTPLPFHRNSLFGYLRSNPAIHSISRKLGGGSSYSVPAASNSSRGRPT